MEFYIRAEQSSDDGVTAGQIASTLDELQNLALIAVFIVNRGDVDGAASKSIFDRNLDQFHEDEQRLRQADRRFGNVGILYARTLRYYNPLSGRFRINVRANLSQSLREILSFFRFILTIDKQRQLEDAKIDLANQEAVLAEIRNAEAILQLNDRIQNKKTREEIETRLAESLFSLMDDRNPRIVRMTITNARASSRRLQGPQRR